MRRARQAEPRFGEWLAQEALLPRFMLGSCWQVLRPAAGQVRYAIAGLLMLLGACPALVYAFGAAHPVGALRAVAGLAAITYLAIVGLAVRRTASVNLWCLRLPAGAALGMVALISLDDGWAARHGWAWLYASAALVGLALGYLLLEAVGHGVAGTVTLVRRVAWVAVLGWTHAVAIAAITLAAVVPAVAPGIDETINGPTAASAAQTLTLAAAVSLAAGVLLQVLWDDRPATYPLTHLPWKGRTR
ncbi:conserved membrane hypothetical protein [Frankia canadensis]|uniref:Uncharacterized protein n=1 Tax=Frankia canadensis TaxID=1836972 RepID=A0A2I2KXX1_9ACTN|nr:conserved membrane hypothetical protein [Frankia canadensis]SOU57796.1 conserved membrane hypothetical protein [Frankia canadensis]